MAMPREDWVWDGEIPQVHRHPPPEFFLRTRVENYVIQTIGRRSNGCPEPGGIVGLALFDGRTEVWETRLVSVWRVRETRSFSADEAQQVHEHLCEWAAERAEKRE